MKLFDKFNNLTITRRLRLAPGATITLNSGTASESELSLAEQAVLDGVTAGTATASKALVLDASKGIATITSATITTLTSTAVVASAGVTSSGSTGAGIGYATGAGGAVTQITNRSTGVTLSKLAGAVTTHTASLAGLASADFVVTNTTVAATDTVIVSIQSGSDSAGAIVSVSTVAAGSFTIRVSNNNAAAGTAETGAIIINFAVIKSVAA